MKKTILISCIVSIVINGCKQVKVKTEEFEKQFVTEITIPEDKNETQLNNTHPTDTVKKTIDNSYFEKEKIRSIHHIDSEYEEYGITKLSTKGIASENSFTYDDNYISFSVIDEIKLFENIHSLIIRGNSENCLIIWLVNYDLNHTYIDSYIVGYDEWAESANWITSDIYILPEPFIEEEYISWETREDNRIEILESGKFKISRTIHSKYEM